jgi:phosphotriesterase-related protein
MTEAARPGEAQTVLGPVAGEALGITLPHEHLLIDFRVMFAEPAAASDRGRAHEPVSLANLSWVRHHYNESLDNLRLTDEAVARDEAWLYRLAGGRTVVDPTNRGLARDPLALARIARTTGLHVVMGAGYYVEAAHPPEMAEKTVDDLAREIVADVRSGVGDTGIRAGLIGEIGCSWPWTANERKSVRAAVWAQRETGAPLMIHPGRHERAPFEILELVRAEGGDLGRTIMCHVDRTIADPQRLLDLAATGCYLEYDLFGSEIAYYPYNPAFHMPNDGQRIAQILRLAGAGYLERLLLSHDIAYKHGLVRYGGPGYHHLLVNVMPQLRRSGFDEAALRTLFVDNPGRVLVFA